MYNIHTRTYVRIMHGGMIMAIKDKTYLCIDMKSFFASVECAELGLNPFETNLVVTDESRGAGAICLAVSPKMKSLGVKNRCRLFEIPKGIDYIIAKPKMKRYIDYAADIYEIYLNYISPEDIHVYSIDECFIDATDYLKCYNLTAEQLVKKLIDEIAIKKGIPATAGIGTNLYLAKIALDITAKKSPEHIGFLNEELYKKTLWRHRPITDFWQISVGTAKRLAKCGIFDMEGIALAPQNILYKIFGINAELLIDHAYGRESCTMADIKAYKGKHKSVSMSQILFEDYNYLKARTVVKEMVLNGCQELMRRRVITNSISIYVGYSKDVIKGDNASVKILQTTNVYSVIVDEVIKLFDKITDKNTPIRKLGISFNNVVDESGEGYDIFTNFSAVQKEKQAEKAVLDIKDRFGKNSILRLIDLTEGATARQRNKLIGGHNGDV